MSDKSAIEWTDATWNPTRGCSMVSPGCANCYAMRIAKRFAGEGQAYHGLVTDSGKWTGLVRLVPHMLHVPFSWKQPRMVFVDSMSDLFHEDVPFEFVDQVFAAMALNQRHTFQVLTKRADRMRQYLFDPHVERTLAIVKAMTEFVGRGKRWQGKGYTKDLRGLDRLLPLPNVHLGVSIEDQATADARIPQLLQTPAAVRFASAEPLLGPVDLGLSIATCNCCNRWPSRWVHLAAEVRGDWPIGHTSRVAPGIYRAESNQHGALALRDTEGKLLGIKPGEFECLPGLDGVICGGESGPNARPMHPDWARSLRDQCQVGGAAFFFKQWGEWSPWELVDPPLRWNASGTNCIDVHTLPDLTNHEPVDGWWWPAEFSTDSVIFRKVRKTGAGRLLDRREHSELPQVKP